MAKNYSKLTKKIITDKRGHRKTVWVRSTKEQATPKRSGKDLMSQYKQNENDNNHTGNLMLLANNFGNQKQKDLAKQLSETAKRGQGLTMDENRKGYKEIHEKLYPKLVASSKSEPRGEKMSRSKKDPNLASIKKHKELIDNLIKDIENPKSRTSDQSYKEASQMVQDLHKLDMSTAETYTKKVQSALARRDNPSSRGGSIYTSKELSIQPLIDKYSFLERDLKGLKGKVTVQLHKRDLTGKSGQQDPYEMRIYQNDKQVATLGSHPTDWGGKKFIQNLEN